VPNPTLGEVKIHVPAIADTIHTTILSTVVSLLKVVLCTIPSTWGKKRIFQGRRAEIKPDEGSTQYLVQILNKNPAQYPDSDNRITVQA
jgi:hypothetical protein